MAMCRTILRANAPGNHSPAAVLSSVNRLIFPDIREDMFISMAYLIVSRLSGETVIARAGHDPPMHFLWRDERVEVVKPPGLAVGIDEGDVFDRVTVDHRLTLERGDVLLLYTDGVNEALDDRGEEFGIDRLRETFATAAGHGAEAVLSAVMTEVREHAGDTRQSDDITLIAVEKR
jgi:sigma-B regulation protein RsbU (phosphoserine phosphatase)